MYSQLDDLYRDYRKAADDHFKHATATKGLLDIELEPHQIARFRKWLTILNSELPARQIIDEPLPHTVQDLRPYLGGGVWRVDYTQERIFYDDLWTNAWWFAKNEAGEQLLKKIRNELLSVPYDCGTIGYIVKYAHEYKRGFRTENTVGDLRGEVLFEDQILGHINVLTCPIFAYDNSNNETVRILLSIFLPVQCIFTETFASSFAEYVRPIGQRILATLEGATHAQIRNVLMLPKSRSDFASRENLFGDIASIAENVRYPERAIQLKKNENQSKDSHPLSFPWIALLKTEPVAASSRDWDDPLELWIEPVSYERWRHLKEAAEMVSHPRTTAASFQAELEQREPFVSNRPWDNLGDLIDIVLPLVNAKSEAVGQIRLHLSAYLIPEPVPMNENCIPLTAAMCESISNTLRSALSKSAIFLRKLRDRVKGTPLSRKTAACIEGYLFSSIFRGLAAYLAGNNPSNILDNFKLDTLQAICASSFKSGTIRKRLASHVREIRAILLENISELLQGSLNTTKQTTPIANVLLGFTYWCVERTPLLVERNPEQNIANVEQAVVSCLARDKIRLVAEETGRMPDTIRYWDPDAPVVYHHPVLGAYTLEFHATHGDLWEVNYSSASMPKQLNDRWRNARAARIRSYYLIGRGPGENNINKLNAHIQAYCLQNVKRLQKSDTECNPTNNIHNPIYPTNHKYANWRDIKESHMRNDVEKYVDDIGGHKRYLGINDVLPVPIYIFNHIYGYLLVGARNKMEHNMVYWELALDMIQMQIKKVILGYETDALRALIVVNHAQRDISHNVYSPLNKINDVINLGPNITPQNYRDLRSNLAIVTRWCNIWAKTHEKPPTEPVQLKYVIESACEQAGNHLKCTRQKILKRLSYDMDVFEDLYVRGQQGLREHKVISLLLGDIICNAVKHSPPRTEINLMWQSGVLVIRNSICEKSIKKEFESTIVNDLNRCLALPINNLSWRASGKDDKRIGLSNIMAWARMARVGLDYLISNKYVSVTLYMSHLVGENNNESEGKNT